MKTKFQYTRTYTFDTDGNGGACLRHFFFNVKERFGEVVSFTRTDKDDSDGISAPIIMDGDVETVTFLYYGHEYSLRADRYIPKGYAASIDGRLEKKDNDLRDAHMHTMDNREEVEQSKFCYCICCDTFFKPEEIEDYADGGSTVLCPYCDCDAVLGDACGITLTDELLAKLHKRYF